MIRYIAATLMCFGLILAMPANADMAGTVVVGSLACFADDLSVESKALLNRWSEFVTGMFAETLTDAEVLEGRKLAAAYGGSCGFLATGLPVIVRSLDGLDYLVEVADGRTFITKADGIQTE